jgi:hypothetical protein
VAPKELRLQRENTKLHKDSIFSQQFSTRSMAVYFSLFGGTLAFEIFLALH